ncbi:uncharacterized protein BDV14DRAFT_181021 [Aspergillus stella-maris]|uniref:uncharacterized protein n=1 Tax=Aspergillus stella-maris TaxID=1810926 RepID=UPI003CCD9F7E
MDGAVFRGMLFAPCWPFFCSCFLYARGLSSMWAWDAMIPSLWRLRVTAGGVSCTFVGMSGRMKRAYHMRIRRSSASRRS